MKNFRIAVSVFVLTFCVATMAHADLDGFLRKMNDQAKADLSRFSVRVSAQFGIPVPKVDDIIKRVAAPSDAFMVFQLGQMANKQPDMVLQTYQSNKGKGWGVIAKQLGIKPGSPEFHALKRGDFTLTGEQGGSADRGHGNGKGKGRGRGKGHGE